MSDKQELSLYDFLKNAEHSDSGTEFGFLQYEMNIYGVDLDSIRIIYTDEALKGFEEYCRRPVFSVIGKPLDMQETIKLLRVTDERFVGDTWKKHYDSYCLGSVVDKPDVIDDCYYQNCWFGETAFNGWLHPNGMIYCLEYTRTKHPTLIDFMRFWVLLSTFTEAIDVIVAVTRYNETLNSDELLDCGIKGGLHIQGKTITVMEPLETVAVYIEYMTRYGKPPDFRDYFTKENQKALFEKCNSINIRKEG